MSERSERSERSEFDDGPRARVAQGSRAAGPTARVARPQGPSRGFAATTPRGGNCRSTKPGGCLV